MNSPKIDEVKSLFSQFASSLQCEVTAKMQQMDPGIELIEDLWQREDAQGAKGGGGRTRAFRGKLFENAGVNTSLIYGSVAEDFAKKIGGDTDQLWACGISLIIHPRNPRVPTVHANFRMIEAGTKVWFGGGADLTPYYPYEEDFRYFHGIWKQAISPYGHYEHMKKTCDEYFVNHHREGEMRGVGGFFFDHFSSGDWVKDFEMVKSFGAKFIASYFPIVERRKDEIFRPEDEEFMLHRRGRYVEFNLLHDRGTMFGLKSKGRTESILISLPARCQFTYNYAPQPGSVHQEMMTYYRPKNWAD